MEMVMARQREKVGQQAFLRAVIKGVKGLTRLTLTFHTYKESKGDQHNLLENQIHQKRMAKLLESLHKVVKALQFIP